MNGSVQWLDVPDPLSNDGPHWIDNILAPIPAWGTFGTAINPNWAILPGGHYGSVCVPCSGTVRSILAYVRRSPGNTRTAVHHVLYDLLRDNRTTRMKILSTSRNIFRDFLVNWRYCDWDDLWDDMVDQ